MNKSLMFVFSGNFEFETGLFVSGSIYLQEVLEGRAGQEVPKNKLDLLVSMQFNFIPRGSLVCTILAFFQSRLYPDKLERCDITKIQICTKGFQNLALFVY